MKRTEHREAEWAFPFIAYEPENPQGKMPLIIQLHGAGERGLGQDDLSLVEVHGFSKLMQKAEYPCMLVMPQCPTGSFWIAKIESLFTFIEQLKARCAIDEDRIYLTGLSMGGYGTWTAAMANPSIFAAIAPVCGGGMVWNAGVLTMPIWAFHGVLDGVVKVENSDDMVAKLRELGCEVKYDRVDGVYHDVWNYAYTEELLAWLLSNRREK